MQQPMAQVQIPVGMQPGQQFQVNMNGMMIMVTCPPGAIGGQTMMVPMPAQPQMMMAPGPQQMMMAPPQQMMAAPPQQMMEDRFGEALIIRQEFAAIEMCGCEAKNRYRVYKAGPNDRSTKGLGQTMYINEESDCFERICCGPNRSLTLVVHNGGEVTAPVLLRLKKPFHLQGCCFCRPSLSITDSDGSVVGEVRDPFNCCCNMDQTISDHTGADKYKVVGNVCQLGMFFPCCGDVVFNVTDQKGGPPGEIRKIFDGCSELCLGTNKFKVTFPKNATEPDKSLLLGATMLVDLEYFEVKKENQ
jgi:hypothetical protein